MTAIQPDIRRPELVNEGLDQATSPVAAQARPRAPSKGARWAGRVFSGIPALFLLFDAIIKVVLLPPAVEGSAQLGYAGNVVFGIGVVELLCVAVYLVPRTAALGAVLLTGYLGGAVATHVRVASPLLSHTLFPIYIAALLWVGLWLRDERVRALLRPNAAS